MFIDLLGHYMMLDHAFDLNQACNHLTCPISMLKTVFETYSKNYKKIDQSGRMCWLLAEMTGVSEGQGQ